MRLNLPAALLGGCLLAPPAFTAAQAHVTLDPPQAAAGAYVRAAFRVPHGCAGAATERLTLRLPEGALSARPMPKPGWTLAITRRPLEVPVPNGHGGMLTETVAEIAWSGGPLPDEHYEEFIVMLRLPETPGETLYLPVTQDCTGGATAAWVEIPAPGRRITDYRMPAPSLRLLPARGRDAAN
jgi:uncharacterized protein YcnI